MDGARRGLALLAAAATLWLAAGPLHAQNTAYKCASRGGTTYADRPCTGARVVGPAGPRKASQAGKARPVPQDRAKIAQRATLSAVDRAECRALDTTMAQQRAALKAKGDAATLDDEMPLVFSKKRFRELRC